MKETTHNPVAWTEIPVTDLDAAVAFYNTVMGYRMTIDTSGPNPMAVIGMDGVAGHLYPGKPANDGRGPTIHLSVPGRLEDTAERWARAGGEIMSPPIEIPPGRFLYARDLDGNSIGLFEPKAA